MDEDYPRSLQELERRFATEAACLAYLAALRWPAGFVCPACKGTQAWETARDLRHCRQCGTQTSVTAGTLFHRTRLPLPVWFRAIWHVTSQKYGANALGLQRVLGLSYETAWQWLHKLRRAMVRPGRDRLAGCVQVDETYVGGRKKPGKRGRGAAGKTLVAIAAEDKAPQGIGRIRLQVLPDASAASLARFAEAAITPGSVIATDDWSGYGPLASGGVHASGAAAQGPRLAAPRGLAPQTVVAGDVPGRGQTHASGVLPRRVHVPLQSADVAESREAVPPARATRPARGSRAREGPYSGAPCGG